MKMPSEKQWNWQLKLCRLQSRVISLPISFFLSLFYCFFRFDDWWWKVALGKCYFRLGMMRDAEAQFKSAIKQQPMVATFLQLGKIYLRLDQPLAALEVYRTGLDSFPNEVHLLVGVARIQEGLGNLSLSAKYYKNVLAEDSTHVEAIACIGMNHFYSDQPELSLRFYRRLLQVVPSFYLLILNLHSRWVSGLLSCTTTLACAASLPSSTT